MLDDLRVRFLLVELQLLSPWRLIRGNGRRVRLEMGHSSREGAAPLVTSLAERIYDRSGAISSEIFYEPHSRTVASRILYRTSGKELVESGLDAKDRVIYRKLHALNESGRPLEIRRVDIEGPGGPERETRPKLDDTIYALGFDGSMDFATEHDGPEISRFTFRYDNSQRVLEKRAFDENGSVLAVMRYSYDQEGRPLRSLLEDSSSVRGETQYDWSERGDVVVMKRLFFGQEQGEWVFGLDETGFVTSIDERRLDRTISRLRFDREFDGQGNWTKELMHTASAETAETIHRREIDYYH